ncbi:hypothetical protein [Streptomyces sp. BH055]|uniref:hypothetical protein n=1 Tax=Streptomyces sp. BH055 TaxID=3401173 RepID=UPI003BB6313E
MARQRLGRLPAARTPTLSLRGALTVVLHAEHFAQALAPTLTHPVLRERPLVGGVDQWADSTDLLHRPGPARCAPQCGRSGELAGGRGPYRSGVNWS